MSSLPEPYAYAWRRYQLGVPVWEASMLLPQGGALAFWPTQDFGQLLELNRWEGLENAFAGFVGDGTNLACAYWLDSIFEILKEGDLVFRSWSMAADAAEAVEFVEQQLLGVWFGEKTPFILSKSCDFLGSVLQNGSSVYHF